MGVYEPGTEAEAGEIVRRGRRARRASAARRRRHQGGIGRPAQDNATLSARALTGVTLYEPAEMVVAARAGHAAGRGRRRCSPARGQMLPFEPMDHRGLLGSAGEPTFGAVAATNNAGPRRINAGAARDSLIGVRFVNGRGEAIKSGGRVMKNVTGLDLVKLMAGVLGHARACSRRSPSRCCRSWSASRPWSSAASTMPARSTALAAALGSPFELTGAAHLPAGIGGPDGADADAARRLRGVASTTALGELRRLLKRFGPPEIVERRGRCRPLAARPRRRPPRRAAGGRALADLHRADATGRPSRRRSRRERDARWFYDWGGGLIWLATGSERRCRGRDVRAAVRAQGGHATLVRAPDAVRAAVPVFQPLAEPLMRITAGIKAAHDPAGVFNPGRMYAGL